MRRIGVRHFALMAAVLVCGVLVASPAWPGSKMTEGPAVAPMGPGPFYKMKLCGRDATNHHIEDPLVILCTDPSNPEVTCGDQTPCAVFDCPASEPDGGCGLLGAEQGPHYLLDFGMDGPNNIRAYRISFNVVDEHNEHPIRLQSADWVREFVFTIHHACVQYLGMNQQGVHQIQVVNHVWKPAGVRPQAAIIYPMSIVPPPLPLPPPYQSPPQKPNPAPTQPQPQPR